MTVQSVGLVTANVNAVSGQAGKTAATDSFGKIMSSRSAEKSQSEPKQTESKKNTDADNRISKSGRSEKASENRSEANAVETKDPAAKQEALFNAEEETVDVKDLEQVLEALASLLNAITEVLTENLQVPEEELLTGALNLDLTPADLLNTDEIKGLFLEMNGAKAEDLISNGELLENLEGILEQVENLLEDFNEVQGEFLEKLSTLLEDQKPVLENPAFNEVLDEYLMAEEPVEPVEETPDFTVEIEDLRNLRSEAQGTEEAPELTAETENLPVAGPEREEETREDHSESGSKDSFVNANTFVKELARANEEGTPEVQQNTFRDLYNISGQTIEQIKVRLTADVSHMEIQLNPEHLGKVEVNISSKNGAVTAEITAHNEAAKRALEAGLEDLKTALNDNGLKVENVEVTLADYGFRNREDSEQSGRGGERRQGRRRVSLETSEPGYTDDFETASEIMKEMNGGNVDYVV
ncbi:MAG: flagellar hook-length control protein FliK [Lachnospiraceae bacterium]|nr:flagellar hook-length control protein FliK [Lachnospiraceae bacterium]